MGRPKQTVENQQQLNTFMEYYQMGDNRSLLIVAEKTGIPVKTLQYWSSKFDWKVKIYKLDLTIAEEMQRKMVKDIVKQKNEYRKIVRNLIAKIINKDTKDLMLKPKNIQDIATLIKMDLTLMGESAEKEGDVSTGSFADIVTKLKSMRSSEIDYGKTEVEELEKLDDL